VLQLLLQLLVAQDRTGFRPVFSFPTTDTVAVREARIGAGLVVKVLRQEDARGTPRDWYVGV
jgi:hypothetical protein